MRLCVSSSIGQQLCSFFQLEKCSESDCYLTRFIPIQDAGLLSFIGVDLWE